MSDLVNAEDCAALISYFKGERDPVVGLGRVEELMERPEIQVMLRGAVTMIHEEVMRSLLIDEIQRGTDNQLLASIHNKTIPDIVRLKAAARAVCRANLIKLLMEYADARVPF